MSASELGLSVRLAQFSSLKTGSLIHVIIRIERIILIFLGKKVLEKVKYHSPKMYNNYRIPYFQKQWNVTVFDHLIREDLLCSLRPIPRHKYELPACHTNILSEWGYVFLILSLTYLITYLPTYLLTKATEVILFSTSSLVAFLPVRGVVFRISPIILTSFMAFGSCEKMGLPKMFVTSSKHGSPTNNARVVLW